MMNNHVYISCCDSYEIHDYNLEKEKWKILSSCDFTNFGLAVIGDELVALGGINDNNEVTGKLFMLQEGKWKDGKYPALNVGRSCFAAATVNSYLVCIGGYLSADREDITTSVEMFHEGSQVWCLLRALPKICRLPSAVVCGQHLYVISTNKEVGYSCSLQHFVTSEHCSNAELTINWTNLASRPIDDATITSLHGKVIIVGGRNKNRKPNSIIYQLIGGAWEKVGELCYGRYVPLAVSVSHDDRVMVVGGFPHDRFSSVEMCTAKVTK